MHGFGGADEGASALKGVLKGKRSAADVSHLDSDDDFIAHKDRGFIIRLSMDDGKKEIRLFEHGFKAPAEFFQEIFISVMDNFQLIGKENDAGCVCIV